MSSKSAPLITVVDDEESVGRALTRLIASAGLSVKAYTGGAEFLASVATRPPDCVVLDLHMPGMSGFEVQAQLVRLGTQIPVVIITGHDTPDSHQRVMSAGAVAYLRKPVDGKVLLEAIATAIARKGP